MSCILDILLKPFLKCVHSYLKDDIDFLKFIPHTVSEHTMLISFDIVSLYTNIPHDFGIEAISYWLDRYPEIIHDRFDKEFIVKGLELILKTTTFRLILYFLISAKVLRWALRLHLLMQR